MCFALKLLELIAYGVFMNITSSVKTLNQLTGNYNGADVINT